MFSLFVYQNITNGVQLSILSFLKKVVLTSTNGKHIESVYTPHEFALPPLTSKAHNSGKKVSTH